jgi:hypothetical protein
VRIREKSEKGAVAATVARSSFRLGEDERLGERAAEFRGVEEHHVVRQQPARHADEVLGHRAGVEEGEVEAFALPALEAAEVARERAADRVPVEVGIADPMTTTLAPSRKPESRDSRVGLSLIRGLPKGGWGRRLGGAGADPMNSTARD